MKPKSNRTNSPSLTLRASTKPPSLASRGTSKSESPLPKNSPHLKPLKKSDGIRFTYILSLIQEWGGRSALAGKTTTQVCEDFILPMTLATKISVCDSLLLCQDPESQNNVKDPSWFISHVWEEYMFLDVIDTLERFFMDRQIPLHEAVVWFDVFSVSQHHRHEEQDFRDFGWWNNHVLESVKQCKNFVLVVKDWEDPVPLKRSWCTMELFYASKSRLNIHVAMNQQDESVLIQQLWTDSSKVLAKFSGFNFKNCVATHQKDQQMISKILSHRIETAKLNNLISNLLKNWLRVFVDQQISRVPIMAKEADLERLSKWYEVLSQLFEHVDSSSSLKNSIDALSECLEIREDSFGHNHPDTLRTRSHLAFLSIEYEDIQFAGSTLSSCLELQRQVLGTHHADTLLTMARLAHVYSSNRMFQESEVLYLECIGASSSPEGFAVADFNVGLLLELAHLYLSHRQYNSALDRFTQALGICMERFGDYHETTLEASLGLAETFFKLNQVSDAKDIYTAISETVRQVFGEPSRHYAQTRIGLATILIQQGCLRQSEAILTHLLTVQQQSLGPNHRLTLKTNAHLASIFMEKGEDEAARAEMILATTLGKQRALFGHSHQDTLETLYSLAILLDRKDRTAEAKLLYEELYRHRVDEFGVDHPDTISILNVLERR
ncbi:hypothetical protein BDR26DRAFT_283640 [Obelidium mucronatum]|nr:hypothetical protein BDR26DRAFT_283640 [Obelidium mucronatum]